MKTRNVVSRGLADSLDNKKGRYFNEPSPGPTFAPQERLTGKEVTGRNHNIYSANGQCPDYAHAITSSVFFYKKTVELSC